MEEQDKLWNQIFELINEDPTLFEHGIGIPPFKTIRNEIIETLKSKFKITPING